MAKLDFKNINYRTVATLILIASLLITLFLIAHNSFLIVSKTNKNNFKYTLKVREALEEVDIIIERSESALNILSNTITMSYNLENVADKEYNNNYIKSLDPLIKAVLINIPGVSGSWFQLNADFPYSKDSYVWYALEHGKISNLRAQLKADGLESREITPEDDPYYFEAIKTNKMFWSKVYTDPDSKVKMISISNPVRKKGKLIGVVGLDISVTDLQIALKNMQSVFEGSEIFLLDVNKKIILTQLSGNRNFKEDDYSFLSKFREKEKEIIEFYENGLEKTAIMMEISSNYNVVISFPRMLLFKGFNRLFKTISLTLIILSILALMAFFNRLKIVKMNKRLEDDILVQKTIIDASPSIIILKDINKVIRDCNCGLLKMLGQTKENIIGKTAYDLLEKEKADLINDSDERALSTGKTVTEEQCFCLESGDDRVMRRYAVPLFDTNKKASGLLIYLVDITMLKKEKELLKQAKEAAEVATAMKSSFIANMSHELRTPLNGVLGFLQLLEETELTELQEEFITNAGKASGLLLNIINEILDFSKIEAGKLQIDCTSFDLRSAVEDVVIISTSSAFEKGIDINSLICSSIPMKVFGDPCRFKQILNNLVGNAIKFTKQGEVIIYANLVSETDDDAVLSIKIKDTGIGIAEDKLKLIFDAFAQGDTSTTRIFGGTGLGLAISQKLAALMNGRISVESTENEGSTFTLELPFIKDTRPASTREETPKSLNGANILLVENNPTDLKIIQYYLNKLNCIIHKAQTIEEVLELTNKENHNISVALIGDKMQDIEDPKFSNLIKNGQYSKDIPLILYTSIGKKGNSILAKQNGFSGVITKPFKQNELIESIALVIDGKGKIEATKKGIATKHSIKENKFDSNAKILLVEDCELNCKLMLRILKNCGLSFDIATNGKEAVEAFISNSYDLVLMDCEMPVLDGYAATKKIREFEVAIKQTTTPIIAMTANALNAEKEKCIKVGMNDYISKPIDIKAFIHAIGKYIKHTHINDEIINEVAYTENVINEIVSEFGFTTSEALELIAQYKAMLPQVFMELETAVENDDFEAIGKIAHKLKGASASMRLQKIAAQCEQLENDLHENNKTACVNTINEIKKYVRCIDEMLLPTLKD